MPQDGMGKILIGAKLLEPGGCGVCVFVCVFLERGNLYFIGTHEEVNMLRWKRKRKDRIPTTKMFQLLQMFEFHS
jgi:hypothetical protein